MNIETLKAVTYITEVAVEELSILQWVAALQHIYKEGIPEEAHFSDVINYFVTKFPDFEERAKDNSQENYDKLYSDFIEFIEKQLV